MFSFRRLLLLFIVSLCIYTTSEAQDAPFQKSLSDSEIESFKEELEFKYRLFFESVLNIIDNDNSIFSRRNAYYLINNLFENEEAAITDYLDNRFPETLTLKEYGPRLFQLENVLPLLDKRYKFSDSISVLPIVKDIQAKYAHWPMAKQKQKSYQVYQGEVFFIEEIISVQKVRKDVFDAIDRNIVKKLKFKIAHDAEDDYRLIISSITILDPRNNAYDYNQIKEEIRQSSKPWSDNANPDYLKEVEAEAQRRGITLVGEKKESSEELSDQKSGWYYDAPTFWDYLLPGFGHLRFGSDNVRYRDAIIHTTTTIGAAGLAYHYHRRSQNYLEMYNDSRGSEEAAIMLNKSKSNSRRSDILKVTTAASYVFDIIHLVAKNKRQKNLIYKVLGNSDVAIENSSVGPIANYSIRLKF